MVVSVLLVINDGIENENLIFDALDLSGISYELLIYNNGCSNTEVIQFLRQRANLVIDSHNVVSTFGFCINELLIKASGTHIFVFNQFGYFTQNWLLDLTYFCDQIVDAGCVNVSTNPKNNDYALTTEHEFVFCYYPDEKEINGNILFSRNLIEQVGGFDTNLNSKQVLHDYLFRVKNTAFVNLIIPEQTYISICDYEDIYQINDKLFDESCYQMSCKKNFFKPIFVQSEKSKELVETIKKAFPDKYIVFSDRSGEISYLESILNYKDLEKIYKLSLEYQFSFEIRVMSDIVNNIFVNRMGIYINK